MGFLSRTFVPRSVRRAVHPVRTAKSAVRKAVVPKSVRKITYSVNQVAHPISAVKYHAIERPLTTAIRGNSRKTSSQAPVYRHGTCPVNHRSPDTAARCRNAGAVVSGPAPSPGTVQAAANRSPDIQGAQNSRAKSHGRAKLIFGIIAALIAIGLWVWILPLGVLSVGVWLLATSPKRVPKLKPSAPAWEPYVPPATGTLPGPEPTRVQAVTATDTRRRRRIPGWIAVVTGVLLAVLLWPGQFNSQADESAAAVAPAAAVSPGPSTGPTTEANPLITVPDVTGMSPRVAQQAVRDAGLEVTMTDASGDDRSIWDDDAWTVVRTSPAAGQQLPSDSEVTVQYLRDAESDFYLNNPAMPMIKKGTTTDALGDTVYWTDGPNDARVVDRKRSGVLAGAFVEYQTEDGKAASDTNGRVLRTIPAAGETLSPGEKITVVVKNAETRQAEEPRQAKGTKKNGSRLMKGYGLTPKRTPARAYYQNCSAARAAGAAPVRVGDPGYRAGLDRDGDGVGCE